MFKLTKIEGGRINVYEPQILTVGTAAVVSGEALVLTGGVLVKCAADAKPTFIALANAPANATVPVGRVESNQIYAVAAPGELTIGEKYTINETGTGITTTTTESVAEVVYADASVAHVRFS